MTCSNILSSASSILQGLISSKFKNWLQRTFSSVVATRILYSLSPSMVFFERKGKSSFLFSLHRRNIFQLLGSIPFSVTFRRTPVPQFERRTQGLILVLTLCEILDKELTLLKHTVRMICSCSQKIKHLLKLDHQILRSRLEGSHMAYCLCLVVNNQRYQILIWLFLTLLNLTKKVDLADFHEQRSFQDHLHVFDKL